MIEQRKEMKPATVSSLGYPVFNGSLDQIPRNKKVLINTINQYSYCIADEDEVFKQALQTSDILLPDGVGIIAAVRLMEGTKITKIAGADLNEHLLEELNRKGGSCYYLGSSKETLQKIKTRLGREYPNIVAGFHSPPYKENFSEKDNSKMLQAVNKFKPDVLFIGMTAPKQEKWAHQHKELLDARIICSIGAVFDFYAGTVKRPHNFWIKLRLEWFIRLLKEPQRMWKRYIYYGPVFIHLVMKEKFKKQLAWVRAGI